MKRPFSLYPGDPAARARIDMLLNWDQGTLYPKIVDAYFTRLGWRPMPDDIDAKINEFESIMKLLNDHLLQVHNTAVHCPVRQQEFT